MSTAVPASARRFPSPSPGSPRRAASGVANSRWGERALRFGIAARGFVFLVIGYLVARIALGALGDGGTSKPASGPGVAQAVAEQKGGSIALVLLGAGLACFALFCLVGAVREPAADSDAKRWAKRGAAVWQAAVYGAFGGYCFTKAFSGGSAASSGRSGRRQSQWSAEVLRWPAGWFWLGLLGVALFVTAAVQLGRAVRAGFRKDLKEAEMSRRTRQLTGLVGRVGFAGRAGAYALVGWFVLHAAIENDPQQGRGVDGSARMLANSSGGPVLLWLLAIGLAVFGVYLFLEARYRRL